MGRKPRIEYAGATYHVMCRGNRREDIFENDGDRKIFLKTLGEVCERTGWKVCAYVLMPNHYHMVLEWIAGELEMGSRANVSRAFRNVEDTKDVTVRKWKRELQKMYGCAH